MQGAGPAILPLMSNTSNVKRQKIGLALGSGSARGWAHIGVIRELAELGIEPDIVSGTSIGALVGGAYCGGQLDMLVEWVRELTKMTIAKNLDISFLAGGGAIKGKRLFDFIAHRSLVNCNQNNENPREIAKTLYLHRYHKTHTALTPD